MTNRDHWRAWRIVVAQLLLPLHAKWPITSVTFAEECAAAPAADRTADKIPSRPTDAFELSYWK